MSPEELTERFLSCASRFAHDSLLEQRGFRTAGPTVNGTECGARRLSSGEPASEGWDLEFESGLLSGESSANHINHRPKRRRPPVHSFRTLLNDLAILTRNNPRYPAIATFP